MQDKRGRSTFHIGRQGLTVTYANNVLDLERRSLDFGMALSTQLAPRLAYLQLTRKSGFDKRVMEYFTGPKADTAAGRRRPHEWRYCATFSLV